MSTVIEWRLHILVVVIRHHYSRYPIVEYICIATVVRGYKVYGGGEI